MISRIRTDCICHPADFRPSRDDFEVVGAFNPGVIEHDGEVILLVRIAERPRERRTGAIGLPRWENAEPIVDWVSEADWEVVDPRVVRHRQSRLVRLTFTSHLRVARVDPNGRQIIGEGERFDPQSTFETYGVEDPRITRIGDVYWIPYVAVSSHGPATALASTRDFVTFERHGVIFPVENKDVVLFPETMEGHYVALHRPLGGTAFTSPEMWLARSPDLVHWGRHAVLTLGGEAWQLNRVGAGAPPLRIGSEWLVIYHGASHPTEPHGVGAYCAGALFLDGRQPERVVALGGSPLLVPEARFEVKGFVPQVVFPTGVVRRDDILQVYYGAADTAVGCVDLRLADVLGAMG